MEEDRRVRGVERKGRNGAGSVPGAPSARAAIFGTGPSSGSSQGAARRRSSGAAAPSEQGAGVEDYGARGAGCGNSSGVESVPGGRSRRVRRTAGRAVTAAAEVPPEDAVAAELPALRKMRRPWDELQESQRRRECS